MMPGSLGTTGNINQTQKVILPLNNYPCHFQMNLINNGQININYHNMQNNYNDDNINNPNEEDEDGEEREENY